MNDKNKIIETLQHTVDAENMLYFCCGQLSSLIKNGRIREKFRSLSEIAKINREFLIERLKTQGINSYFPQEHCRFCNIKAESFSLLGTVNLGLEIIELEIKLYKELLRSSYTKEDQDKFKQTLDEKIHQRAFLKKEKRFASKDENRLNFINSYCIPDIVAKLWK